MQSRHLLYCCFLYAITDVFTHYPDISKTSPLLGSSGLCVTVRGILNPCLPMSGKQEHTDLPLLPGKTRCVAVLYYWIENIKAKQTVS